MDDLDLMSFDLGEIGGGEQVIFAHKPINENEYYVLTLGNGPKSEQETTESQTATGNQNHNKFETAGKQLLDSIRNRIPGLNKISNKNAVATDGQSIKLRCFKLSRVEGKKYLIDEYVTPQGVSQVARFIGVGKNNQDISK